MSDHTKTRLVPCDGCGTMIVVPQSLVIGPGQKIYCENPACLAQAPGPKHYRMTAEPATVDMRTEALQREKKP